MLPELHKGIAFIASSLITRKTYTTIEQDHQQPSLFIGELNECIDLHDFDRGTQLRGSYLEGAGEIHDDKTASRLTLEVSGNTFQGWDERSQTAFRGSVDRDRIFLFDEETRRRHVFTAQPERTTCRPRVMRPALSGATETA